MSIRTHGDGLLAADVELDRLDAALTLSDDLLKVGSVGRVTSSGDDADLIVARELTDSLEANAAERGDQQRGRSVS